MKTRSAMTAAFASLAAVLVGWQFSVAAFAPHSPQAASAGKIADQSNTSDDPIAPTTSTPKSTAPNAATTSKFRDGTVTGQSVNTPFGVVQVKVIVASGSISNVVPIRLTDVGDQSVQIDNYAVPILHGEVLQSQSAHVSGVSGATYTSEAYLGSLQSALDRLAK